MKYLNTLFLFLIFTLGLHAQARWNVQYYSYINSYKDLAIEQMIKYRIPASITLAQGLFESGAGKSFLATKGNNHFGIKCGDWTGPGIYKDDDTYHECFRTYANVRDSYEDHSKFLALRSRYRSLFSLDVTDYRGWAYGLKACGYATNPTYAQRLIEIIELYKLYVYDRATSYDHFLAEHSGSNAVSHQEVKLHRIYMYNDNYYLLARMGDTFVSIGKEVEISPSQIAKSNEREIDEPLRNGEIIYLKKKKKRAEERFKNYVHVVKPGESMYDISQMYGMRLKYLYKINHLPQDHQINVGEKLRVY